MEATSQPCFSHNYLRSSENYNSSLHSTRKQPAKPWKRPVTASLQRMHPRVYRVEPVNFKELVQSLTGAPQDHERDEVHQVETKPLLKIFHETTNQENPLAFDLSPSSSRFWEAFPLLSPANLSRCSPLAATCEENAVSA
ncbi:hypothetical protein HID58_036132 [Brassica napus]|uniref:VQ domain-containing protein n=1 Tax=Brassica napus TaxID=3708 RepID=A0ABQ8C6V6_BRANA|nr:hypothetical protein HID58_036132 [Brassica napus]